MKRIVVSCCLVLLLCRSLALADFRFVHMSDTHFGAGNNQQADVALFKEISALSPQPAFCVNTGDVCEIGHDSEYQVFRDALTNLKPRMYIAPGNHDVRWNPRGKEGYTRGTDQPLYQSWDYEKIHFVTLDSTVLLQHWGHISQEQLAWLKGDLEKVGTDRPVIIGFHHPIGGVYTMVDNQEDLLRVVEPYNVVLWLQGHGHGDVQWSVNGVPAIMQKGLYQGSYMTVDVSGDEMKLRRRALVDPKKRKNNELVQDKSAPAAEEFEWQDLMTIPLTKLPRPRWIARATVAPREINVTAEQGSLPQNAKMEVRIDGGKYDLMHGGGGVVTGAIPTSGLAPGEHLLTVQATLVDGRAYQKPVPMKVDGDIAPVWETNIGGAVQSRLVRDGELLYLPSMGNDLVALHAADGKEAFRVKTDGPVYCTPHVEDGVAYFGSADHFAYAADAKTGAVKWKAKTGGAVLGGASKAKGVVCIASVDTTIYGLNADNGEVMWRVQAQNMCQSKAATDGERFFVGTWDNHFRCIDAKSGQVLWDLKLGKTGRGYWFSPYAPAITSPAIGDRKVFVSTNDGILHGLRITDGHELWRVDWKNMGYSSPCYRNGRVYCALSDKGKTFCVDADSGVMLWQADVGSVIYDSSFCYGGGNVFIGCVNGTLNAIDAASGKIQWQYRLGPGHLLDSPAADDERVYISSMSGKVTALPTKAVAGKTAVVVP